jgi:hypothetical protein
VSKKLSSLRATGCSPCPINTNPQLPSSSTPKRNDPFLMFRELDRGWHSEIMSVTYLPLPIFTVPEESAHFLSAKVKASDILRLTAIRHHEDPGHSVLRKFDLDLDRFVLIAAALGYEALWEVMRSSSMEHWIRLQKLNDFICKLDNATKLDSELNANFIGFVSMIRDFPNNIWPMMKPKITELEQESFNYIAETFGGQNRKQKELILKKAQGLNRHLKDGRIDLQGLYSQQNKIIKKLVKRSLHDSFGPEQLHHFVRTGDTYRVVDDALRSSAARLDKRGLASFNPIKGISYTHYTGLFYASEIDNARIQVRRDEKGDFRLRGNAYDLHSFIGIDEINKIKNDPFEYMPLCSLSTDYTLYFNETAYIEDLLSAYGHDFMVDITFGAPRKIGFSFIRLRANENTQPTLMPYLLFPNKPKYEIDPVYLMDEAILRSNIAALIFFETLRVMVANQRLSGCPMRFIPWAVRTPADPNYPP